MLSITSVKDLTDILTIQHLASIIWKEHYTAIIGVDQVNYMLKNFQSEMAIKEQIRQHYQYCLIHVEDQAIGYFSTQKNENSIFLSKLYVLKDFRGKGVGNFALSYIQNEALKLGCNRINLTVNKYNLNTIKAYQKMGFTIVDEIVSDIGNNFVMDDFVMEKMLLFKKK